MSAKVKGYSKKSKVKQKRIKAVHQKVKLFRANEPLLSVFMWGVNHRVYELEFVPPPVMLMPDDFKAYSKTKIDSQNFNKETMPSHYKIKEYCPMVFRNLREQFGVDDRDFVRSLTRNQPVECDSPSGRSGARFFTSYDHRFLMKTMSAEEVGEMHSILKPYHEYIVERHSRTMVPQYMGMYRVTVDGAETYILVMRNIFGRRYPIHKKFDLKGSTIQRQASEKEKAKEIPTFKDNDFVNEGCKLHLTEEARNMLIEMLDQDTQFLAKLHLMDYSLIVGIHDLSVSKEDGGETGVNTGITSGETTGRSGVAEDGEEGLPAQAIGATPRRDLVTRTSSGGEQERPYATSFPVDIPGSGSRRGSGKRAPAGGKESTSWEDMGQSPPAGDSSDVASMGSGDNFSQPTPPASPVPSTGAFAPLPTDSDIDLSGEFYAISSKPDVEKREIYFIGLIDILTHYGMKKRTANVAKNVKYGSEAAENISTVQPKQYGRRLLDFTARCVVD